MSDAVRADEVSTTADRAGASRTTVGTFAERFAETTAADGLSWDVGDDLLGAFGGLFGGLVAAMAARAARLVAPGRQIAGVDVIFERPLLPGTATSTATVRRAGRALSVIDAVVVGPGDVVAARAVVTCVDPAALRDLDEDGPGDPIAPWVPYLDGAAALGSRELYPPLVTTLEPRSRAHPDGWIATVLALPWDVAIDPDTVAEAVCFAGDMAVGAPVARHLADRWGPHPNPDLSVRICAAVAPAEVAGVARLARIAGGVAVQELEVIGPDGILGVGSSCSLLLGER